MTTKERYKRTIDYFLEHRPAAETELIYTTPYELTVAVILSAQCTDKRVNIITPPFFEKFSSFSELAKASQEDIYGLIKSCTYPNNKAKNLVGMARGVMEKFGGSLPMEVDELIQLPGVGRKTANVLASVLYDKPVMAVDTHVFRVAARIGLTTGSKNPLQTEKLLVKNIPENLIPLAHHWLILHGRYVCVARKPKCYECGLRSFCRYYSAANDGEIVNNS